MDNESQDETLYDLLCGGQHVDYQLKTTCPGLKSGTRTRLKTFILRDLSATAYCGETEDGCSAVYSERQIPDVMRLRIGIIASLLCVFSIFGLDAREVKVYKGTSIFSGDVLCTVRDSKVYKERAFFRGDIICNVKDGVIYNKDRNFRSDILFTVKDGVVYQGSSTSWTEIVMTIKDGNIYEGDSTFSSDIMANIKDRCVYSGRSFFRSDIKFSFDGPLTVEEFVAVWYAVMYVH